MYLSPVSFAERKRCLRRLAEDLGHPETQRALVDAYVHDTAFVRANVVKREIWTPRKLLSLPCWDEPWLERLASEQVIAGRVAVLIPKNSLGLTLGKAIASSFVMGHETIVRMPQALRRTTPIYERLLCRHLPGVVFAAAKEGGAAFLDRCMADTTIETVVIYGDDAWIDPYWERAKRSRTKLLFEGPGSDPLVVMPDADIESAVQAAIRGGLNNGGQSCSAFERFFVHESVAEAFTARLCDHLRGLRLGSPLADETEVGPIASRAVLERIVRQLEEAQARGATLRTGGDIARGDYGDLPILTPAVLTGCTADMTVVADETFGPVFPILEFGEARALVPALDATRYGLNAAVYGRCPPALAAYLESNHRNVYYNGTPVDPETIGSRMVDGGYRRSGFVWEARQEGYGVRHGRRFLVDELARKTTPLQRKGSDHAVSAY